MGLVTSAGVLFLSEATWKSNIPILQHKQHLYTGNSSSIDEVAPEYLASLMPNQRSSANLFVSSWAPCVRPIIAYFKCPPSIPNQGLPMAWSICSVNIPCIATLEHSSSHPRLTRIIILLLMYIPMVSSWYNYIAAEHANGLTISIQHWSSIGVISKDPTKSPRIESLLDSHINSPSKILKPTTPAAHLAGHVNACQARSSHAPGSNRELTWANKPFITVPLL